MTGNLTLETAVAALAEGDRFLGEGSKRLEFDLGGLDATDSAALAVLLEWRRRAARAGVTLVYGAVPERLRLLAEISDLVNVLDLEKMPAGA